MHWKAEVVRPGLFPIAPARSAYPGAVAGASTTASVTGALRVICRLHVWCAYRRLLRLVSKIHPPAGHHSSTPTHPPPHAGYAGAGRVADSDCCPGPYYGRVSCYPDWHQNGGVHPVIRPPVDSAADLDRTLGTVAVIPGLILPVRGSTIGPVTIHPGRLWSGELGLIISLRSGFVGLASWLFRLRSMAQRELLTALTAAGIVVASSAVGVGAGHPL